MRTLELMILSELHKRNYRLNEEMTDINSVIEYLEISNAESTPDNVYTPEDWVSDTIYNYPEYLIKDDWYIVREGEILYTVDTDAEVEEIISQDKTGELEAYPKEAYVKEDVKSLGR